MSVFLSDDELNTFKNNGVTEDQLQDTVNQYRNEGVSDDKIRSKIDIKLNSFQNQSKSQNIQQNQNNNEDENLPSIQVNEDGSPQKVLQGHVGLNQNWDKDGKVYYTDDQGYKVEQKDSLNPIQKFGRKIKAGLTNLGSYIDSTDKNTIQKKRGDVLSALSFAIPVGVGGKLVSGISSPILKRIATWGMGGGLSGAVEGVAQNVREGEFKPSTIIGDTALGTIIGGATGGVTKGVSSLIKGIRQKAAKKAAENAIQDFGTKTAENTVNKNINVGAYIPENATIKEIDKTETFYNEKTAKNKQKEVKNDINNLKVEELKSNYITNKYKNHFWKTNVDDPMEKGLKEADKELNSIIN